MKKVTFGEQFVWEPIDEYTSSAVDGSADVACVINDILSDSSRLKELNYKDHGTIDMYYCAAQLFSFKVGEYVYICHYIYDDEHQAYLFRHLNPA